MEIRMFIVAAMALFGLAWSQTQSSKTTSGPSPTTTPPSATTTPESTGTTDVTQFCKAASKDCNTCLRNAKCMWCTDVPPADGCVPYPVGSVFPIHKCKGGMDAARWGVCWVNFKILLIVMGCLAGVILISLSCCIYCCCCRSKGNKKKYQQEEAKYERQKEERRIKSEERRAERKEKHDEIRRKYGLVKDDNPYQRFDA